MCVILREVIICVNMAATRDEMESALALNLQLQREPYRTGRSKRKLRVEESVLREALSVKTVETMETMETMETVKSVKSVKSVKTAKSVETMETMESVKSVESVKTVETMESVKSVKSVEESVEEKGEEEQWQEIPVCALESDSVRKTL